MAINKRIIRSNDEGGVGTSFATVTYTGNGGTQSTNSLLSQSGTIDFQPDLVWIKQRNGGNAHYLQDSVRGNTKTLNSNETYAEGTVTNGVTSFNADGFSLGNSIAYNGSSNTYVAWCWKAAGYANTFNVLENGSTTSSATAAGAGITAGSLTTSWSVSANRDSGFSIVRFEPSDVFAGIGTVGHGLNNPPKIIITKSYDPALPDSDIMPWLVYSEENGPDWEGFLNTTIGKSLDYERWERTSPTTSVFTVGQSFSKYPTYSGSVNIAYCFAEVAGFSKFGSYDGTGAAGNFISTSVDGDAGFEPAFVMIKRTNSDLYNWNIFDNKRGSGNYILAANTSSAEDDTIPTNMVFNSNGFTLNNAGNYINSIGGEFIYMAFANQF